MRLFKKVGFIFLILFFVLFTSWITVFVFDGGGITFFLLFMLFIIPLSFFVRDNKRSGTSNLSVKIKSKVEMPSEKILYNGSVGDAMMYLELAKTREGQGDYLGARVEYMKSIEILKRFKGEFDEELRYAQDEYDEFVKRDPIYAALLSRLIPIIEAHPGMLQSDITKNFKKADLWSELTRYKREVTKEDIGYALYFASKQGIIMRMKKGRSYELRVVKDVPV